MSKKSQNARKHGAQAEPPKSLVLVHLKYILGHMPDAGDLIYPIPKLAAAMHLASCEVRLDQAYAHYVQLQVTQSYTDLDDRMEGLDDLIRHARENFHEVKKAVLRILKIEGFSTIAANREKKLANRYLREAWSMRGRALEAYLEI
jgi:hypothetical protein